MAERSFGRRGLNPLEMAKQLRESEGGQLSGPHLNKPQAFDKMDEVLEELKKQPHAGTERLVIPEGTIRGVQSQYHPEAGPAVADDLGEIIGTEAPFVSKGIDDPWLR